MAKRLWKEGKHIDLWTIVHILGGGVLACLFIFLDVGFWYGILFSFVILLIWELYEFFGPIKEHLSNQITDMVVGLLGFLVTHWFLLDMALKERFLLFIVMIDVFVILEVWGYLSHKKKSHKI